MDLPLCIVVVPCYNEEQRLNIQAFSRFCERDLPIRLLFVNDGSRDNTLLVLEQLRLLYPEHVSVLNKQPNGGKAEAVRVGMLHAIGMGAAFTGFWDADLATPLEQVPELLEKLENRPEMQMVFGARVRLLGRNIRRQAVRHYLGRVFATVASTVLHLPIYDTQCGAKLFRVTPDLERILGEPFRSRWIFDVEILARFIALHQGRAAEVEHSIYEFPLPVWTDVAGSKVKSSDFVRALGELLDIYRAYL
jgi:dolichyl-phosphate beta-glucosyltransferase